MDEIGFGRLNLPDFSGVTLLQLMHFHWGMAAMQAFVLAELLRRQRGE